MTNMSKEGNGEILGHMFEPAPAGATKAAAERRLKVMALILADAKTQALIESYGIEATGRLPVGGRYVRSNPIPIEGGRTAVLTTEQLRRYETLPNSFLRRKFTGRDTRDVETACSWNNAISIRVYEDGRYPVYVASAHLDDMQRCYDLVQSMPDEELANVTFSRSVEERTAHYLEIATMIDEQAGRRGISDYLDSQFLRS